jgi:hypothetical protein
MPTNSDYWNALASRLGARLNQFPSTASAAASRFGSQARSGLSALGSAAQTYSALPLTAARTAGSAARSFGDALVTGEDPFEPGGPPTELIQTPMPSFEDVQSGVTTSAPPVLREPEPMVEPEPPRVVQTPGSIRYQLPGGEWKEFRTGDTAPTIGTGTIHDPEDPMRPHSYTPASGGGTVSMMTAPQNAGILNQASNEDELNRRINEKLLQMTLEDPSWRERAKSDAKVGEAIAIEQGKAGVARAGQQEILQQLAQHDAQIDADLQAQMQQAMSSPRFQQMPQAQRDQLISAAQSEAAEAKRAYRERVALATGNVTTSFRPGMETFP